MKVYKFISLVICIFLVACFGTKKVVSNSGPSQTDVDRVQSKFPGYTLAELNEGKNLYETKCNTCHGLKNLSRSEDAWRNIVPDMVEKANRKKSANIDSLGQQKILKYVITMSGK